MKKKNQLKKITAMLLTMFLVLPTMQVKAAETPVVTPAPPVVPVVEAVQIQEIEYNNGIINVEFCDIVDFAADFKVTIKDESNTIYLSQQIVKGMDDLKIYSVNLPIKKNLTVTIDGIKYFDQAQFGSVTGTFKTESNDVLIKKIEVKSDSQVDVSFKTKVKYRRAKVKIVDQNKKEYPATVKFNSGFECSIIAKGMPNNTNFTFEISGIRTKGSKEYTTVSGVFFISKKDLVPTPGGKVNVKVDEVEFEDDELSIEFKGKVSWNNPTVKITDKAGKVFEAELSDYDREECTIVIEGLEEGETYYYEITGIKSSKDKEFGTITGKFKAEDDDDDDEEDDD